MRPFTRSAHLLIAAALATGVGVVTTAPGIALADDETHVCSGTPSAPGTLSGSFDSVVVRGFCQVNAGVARVEDDLTVANSGVLIAAFGRNSSRLIVGGDVTVADHAVAVLGCNPSSSPCFDDNPSAPTLTSAPRIGGNLSGDEALGIIVHSARVGGWVHQIGGGGGKTCTPIGPFAALGFPVFSAYEDSTIGGGLTLHGLNSCWAGVIRNQIGGTVLIDHDRLADPDAIEIESNNIGGNLVCHEDSRVWDSSENGQSIYPRTAHPNTVAGDRQGQCVLATPTTNPGHMGPGPF